MRRRLSAALAGLIVALSWPAPASAHAVLLSTDPVDGQVVPVAPQQVRLVFNEPVQIRPGGVRLLTSAGADTGASARATDATVGLDVPAGVADGTYIVTWRVISADGHPVAGGFSFSIGAPTPGTVAVPQAAAPSGGLRVLRPTVEAMGYLGTLGAAGVIVFALFFAARPAPVLHGRLRRTGTVLTGLGVAGVVASIPVSAAWQEGSDVAALFTAAAWRTDDQMLATLLTAAGMAAGLTGLLRGNGTRRWAALACGGAGLAAGAFALTGHTRTFGPGWLVLASDLAHVSAAAIWLGGIAGLVATLAGRPLTAGAAAATVGRFSAAAAAVVAVLVAAGILLGWRILGSWNALFGTGYGRTLLVKAAIAGLIVGVAALNRYRLLPRIQRQDASASWRLLNRTVRLEAVMLAAVVGVTGIMVTQPPTLQTGQATADTSRSGVHKAALGQGQATLTVTPGAVGANSLALGLLDANGTPVEPIEPPKVRVTLPARDVGPLTREVSRVGPGRYEAVSEFPLSGAWRVEVSVRVSTFDNPVAYFTVDIP